MIPLNEYPKEELQALYRAVQQEMDRIRLDRRGIVKFEMLTRWIPRIGEAISDQEFKEKELPFKTE